MTNDECLMTNVGVDAAGSAGERGDPLIAPNYDLEERTAVFAETVIDFAAGIPLTPVTSPLVSQLIRSATSIGANYCEADDAESKRDFRHKIGICRKEARETKFWFRMVARAVPATKPQSRTLWQEAKELHLIFAKIRRSCDK